MTYQPDWSDKTNSSLFQPQIVLPAQFYASGVSHAEPEKMLLLAALKDAVRCYRKYVFASDRVRRARFREAEAWLMDEDSSWPFSFENVCGVLGLEPTAIRGELNRWRRKEVAKKGNGSSTNGKAGQGKH
ncbi:MAG: hypothetical protein HY695_17205 [Deltaproteobacteria bacterium]|nr:hypothetical protein [Deltaproteobacteria bacterium]